MKAKITYTVNLEDIPEEVSQFIDRTRERLEKAHGLLSSTRPVHSDNIASAIEKVDLVRRQLSDIDLQLEDCHAILLGYQQTMNPEQNLDFQKMLNQIDQRSDKQEIKESLQQNIEDDANKKR